MSEDESSQPPGSSWDNDESSIVRRMAEAVDRLSSDQSLSETSIRDILVCLTLLARHSSDGHAENANGLTEGGHSGLPITLEHFEIREMVGHGGFGVVFRAFDTLLGREVALKLPRPDSVASPDTQRRFLREAQAAAVLDHPGIISVYDVGELGPLWYMACALVRGPTLARWLLEKAEPPSPPVAAQIVANLADAVQHAHERGVLHLDLKPSNVLLDPISDAPPSAFAFIPRLGDFGLASRTGSGFPQSRSIRVEGTLRYMSPEQARGDQKQIATASDVYGLGVILYELLTRRTPFLDESPLALLQRIESEEPQSIRAQCPEIPRDLEAICLKCLEKEPKGRFASARDLATDLRRFLHGLPVTARPIGRLQKVVRSCRRHPAVAALATGVFASLALGIGGIAYQWRETQSQAAEAIRQAAIAEREKRDAEKHLAEVQQSLLDMAWMFQEASPFLVGEPHILNEIHGKLKAYHSQLIKEGASPELQLSVSAAFSTFAALAAMENAGTTTDPVQVVQFRQAADHWWEVIRKWPDRSTYRRALTLHLLSAAEYHRRMGKMAEAKQCRVEAVKALEPPWSGTEADHPAMVHMATQLDDLAATLRRLRRNDDAICLEQSIVMLFGYLRKMLPDDKEVLRRWAKARCRLAADKEQGRSGAEADEILALTEGDLSPMYEWKSPDLELGLVLADVLRRRAVIARDRKDLGGALVLFTKASQILDNSEAAHWQTPSSLIAQPPVLRGLGHVQLALGDKAAALVTLNRCRDCMRISSKQGELSNEWHMRFGRTCADAGTLAIDLKQTDKAENAFTEAIEGIRSRAWMILGGMV